MKIALTKSIIRDWRVADAASLVRHANNRKIWINLRDSFPYPYRLSDAHQWISSAAFASPVTDFAIEIDCAAAGGIGLRLREDVFRRSAEIGYWLGEEYWGRGVVTEAVAAMTEYAFSAFGLLRVYAGVFAWNPASMRVLEKAGYRLEGVMRKGAVKDGRTVDEYIYAIVR